MNDKFITNTNNLPKKKDFSPNSFVVHEKKSIPITIFIFVIIFTLENLSLKTSQNNQVPLFAKISNFLPLFWKFI